jgi:hypothetical protein
MLDPRRLVLHYQAACLGNAARIAWSRHRRDSLVIGIGGGFLLLHEADVLHSEIAEHAAAMAAHGTSLLIWSCGLAAAAGVALGWRAVGLASFTLARCWLAVLPWPGFYQSGLAAICAGMLFSWASWLTCGAAAGLSGLAFGFGFLAAVMLAKPQVDALAPLTAASPTEPTARRPAPRSFGTRLDAMRPKWCSRWALARLSAPGRLGWCAAAILLSATGCVIGAVQAWPFAAITASWLAAHMVFLATLNAAPLVSPVLRTQPLAYVAAAAGVLRGPLGLSCLTFTVSGAAAMALAGVPFGMFCAAAGILLCMDLIAGIVSAGLPGTRGLALIVYASSVSLTLYEHLEYGDAIYLCLAAFTAFLFVRGRTIFRGI